MIAPSWNKNTYLKLLQRNHITTIFFRTWYNQKQHILHLSFHKYRVFPNAAQKHTHTGSQCWPAGMARNSCIKWSGLPVGESCGIEWRNPPARIFWQDEPAGDGWNQLPNLCPLANNPFLGPSTKPKYWLIHCFRANCLGLLLPAICQWKSPFFDSQCRPNFLSFFLASGGRKVDGFAGTAAAKACNYFANNEIVAACANIKSNCV